MAADESTTQDTHETAEGSTTPVEATEEETAAEVAESPAGEAAEATAAPDVRFDPTNPFAVPEGLLPLIEAETVERRRRRPAADPVPEGSADDAHADDEDDEDRPAVSRRRRRRRRGTADMELAGGEDGDPEDTVTRVRAPRQALSTGPEAVQGVKGSTRLEAKRQRRRESRSGGRRRTVITEAEFLARRESVDRKMLVRQREHRIQIAVLEDGVLAEHFVSNTTQDSMIGNVYLGKVQNVLPSMEAAFVDIGRGRNAVLYAGEVDWDAAQLDGKAKKIENALKSGDTVLVQVTKDPVGHKGARLTSQISLPGRYLVYVPGGTMTGISRKLPDVERARLKKILKDHLPQDAGVIVRTAAEGTSEQELQNDINRLRVQWEGIQEKASSTKTLAPELLYAEPDLTIKTVRDVFNEDFSAMLVQGEATWDSIEAYVTYVAPHLLDRLHHWVPEDHDGEDLYATHRVDEQLHKALERKVYLPSGGSLVIDRTEAMTVVDVNTGKFTGSGGNLEETVTKNNLEAAEEVVRQLRLRDIGGIIVIDFIDMVLESNQDLVLRRLVECLGRDRTKHQVAEVTSLGLVQMTRKRMGTGLVEVFSEVCEHCGGRGILIQDTPVERNRWGHEHRAEPEARRRNKRHRGTESGEGGPAEPTAAELTEEERLRAERAAAARTALMSIAKASGKAADEETSEEAAPRAEDAPEEAADEERPSPAGDAEEQGGSESGGRRRKRRGRRRGRGRGGDDAARSAEEQDAPAVHPAEEAGAPDPAETATEDADADSASDAPAAQAEADEDGRSGGRRRSRRRGGRRAESPQGSGAPASAPAASVEAEQDSEEAAGAAEAEEALAAEEAPASPEPAAVVTFDGEPVAVPRRRRSRRATGDGVSAPRPSGMDALEAAVDRRAEDAAAAAQRSPATPAATPTAAPEPAPAPAAGEGPAAAPRRRSRRAVSADGAAVQVQEGAAARGGRFTAQAAQAAPAGATAAPVMLGVGVKAADIVRGE